MMELEETALCMQYVCEQAGSIKMQCHGQELR